MSETTANERDARGEWRPAEAIQSAPIMVWPLQPGKVFKWLFGWQGFIWPENIFWLGLAAFTWAFLTPDLATMQTLELWWIGLLYVRNLACITLVYGVLHYFLYIRKSQGDDLRYNTKPFATKAARFKFKDQVKDNVFHTLAFGVPVMTAYEVATYWLFANGYLGFFELTSPLAFWGWFVFLAFLAPFIHAAHFYFGHRLLHVRFFYKNFHALHHNNIQVGPWSGLSMHPVEHIIYFSTVLVQWLIALHPVNALYQIHLAAYLPGPGHCGFEKFKVFKGVSFASGSNFHYQHHKYFECNYGGSLMPLDQWFGTFHDGTEEATRRLREQMRARRENNS